jgi:TIR domain
MRAIFISYRREDTEGHAGRLFRDLAERFGKELVFMDVAGIEPGRDFRRVIEQQVASCGVLLALIGKDWLTVPDAEGRRRLDDPIDFVRLETASALKRDIPVVPVLVHGARIPRPEQLPEDLRELAYRNSVELTHARWDSDVQVLIKALLPYVDAAPEGMPIPPLSTGERPKRWLPKAAIASALVIALAAGSYLAFDKVEKPTVVKTDSDKAARENAESDATSKRVEAETAKAAAERIAQETAASEEISRRVAAEQAKHAADKIASEKADPTRGLRGRKQRRPKPVPIESRLNVPSIRQRISPAFGAMANTRTTAPRSLKTAPTFASRDGVSFPMEFDSSRRAAARLPGNTTRASTAQDTNLALHRQETAQAPCLPMGCA